MAIVRHGKFPRDIVLSASVDADCLEARYQDGALTITLPKAERWKAKCTEVKTG